MNERIKIVYIGAGSGAWALSILRDLIASKDLSNSEIVFVDINNEKLSNTVRLAKKYNEITNGNLKISGSLSIEEALVDANFVINSVLAGPGHTLQEKVRSISEEYGYYRGIESKEFNMISDYSTMYSAQDQYMYIKNLIKNIHDISKDAWLISMSNPMFELQTIINRDENKIKAVSYCDGTLHLKQIANFFGVNDKNYRIAGINHNIWITNSNKNDEELYKKIDDWVNNESQNYWRNNEFYKNYNNNIDINTISENVQFSKAAVDMYKTYNLFPVGDTVRSGTWKYHYNMETKKKWYGPYGGFDSEIGWDKYLQHIDENNKEMSNLYYMDKNALLSAMPPELGDDPIIPFIEAILFDKKIMAFLDVKNSINGENNIKYLPEDIAVEIPVDVDKNGIHPEKVNGLNEKVIKETLVPRWVNLEMALTAFENGDKSILLDSLYRDPRTKTDEQAELVLDKILSMPENITAKKLYK